MAIVPNNRPRAMVRRVTTWSLGIDVVAALAIGLLISGTLGWIVFLIGLVITGVLYYNFRRVMHVRGMR
jgi:uncharacterized membrane protein YdbT with pleckstrin-like domain